MSDFPPSKKSEGLVWAKQCRRKKMVVEKKLWKKMVAEKKVAGKQGRPTKGTAFPAFLRKWQAEGERCKIWKQWQDHKVITIITK